MFATLIAAGHRWPDIVAYPLPGLRHHFLAALKRERQAQLAAINAALAPHMKNEHLRSMIRALED